MTARTPRRLTLLALCGLASTLIYLVGFTVPYGLPAGIERPLQHFGHLSGPSTAGTVGYITCVSALFGLYLVAIQLSRSLEGSWVALLTVCGGGAASALALIWMYPLFSLDVFYYMAADRIWSVFRENPFVVPPLQAAHDPFFPYTRWGHYPLPYGPLWPWISAATSNFAGSELLPTLLSFKMLSVLGYLLCLPLVPWAARGLRAGRPVAAATIFAWNPLVLLELAGSAHNDAIALIPVALAVGLWVRRSSAAAALSMVVSILIKATAIVAVPGLLLASAQRAATNGRIPHWVLSHLVPSLALGALAWLPWQGAALTSQFREAGQYYQSLSALVAAAFPAGTDPAPIRVVQAVLFIAFAAAYLSQRRALAEEGRPALTAIWGLTVIYFLAVSPFLSAWYMLWPVLYAAVLAEPKTTWLTTLLCAGALSTYMVQFVARPALNLGGMETSAIGLILTGGPFLAGLAWMQRARRPEPTAAVVPTSAGVVEAS